MSSWRTSRQTYIFSGTELKETQLREASAHRDIRIPLALGLGLEYGLAGHVGGHDVLRDRFDETVLVAEQAIDRRRLDAGPRQVLLEAVAQRVSQHPRVHDLRSTGDRTAHGTG